MASVAQQVRAPDCGSGGRGFDSRRSPSWFFEIAWRGVLGACLVWIGQTNRPHTARAGESNPVILWCGLYLAGESRFKSGRHAMFFEMGWCGVSVRADAHRSGGLACPTRRVLQTRKSGDAGSIPATIPDNQRSRACGNRKARTPLDWGVITPGCA